MDEPSPIARDVLAAYRRRSLSDDAHARVRSRLADSIARRDRERSRARHETRRRIAIVSVLALAAAAAIVLFVRGLQSESARPGADDDRGQAPYEHTNDELELPSQERNDDPAAPPVHAAAPARVAPTIPSNEPEPPTRRAPQSALPDPEEAERTLAEELEIVRRVHAALDRNDANAALAAIADHERRFTSGQLVEERKSLRIEALCRAGKGSQARAEAATFLREHAGSAHADRVRSACPRP